MWASRDWRRRVGPRCFLSFFSFFASFRLSIRVLLVTQSTYLHLVLCLCLGCGQAQCTPLYGINYCSCCAEFFTLLQQFRVHGKDMPQISTSHFLFFLLWVALTKRQYVYAGRPSVMADRFCGLKACIIFIKISLLQRKRIPLRSPFHRRQESIGLPANTVQPVIISFLYYTHSCVTKGA
ncbi:hypothetical protein GGI42DRAFT_37059 [Trichoderma sp. SZMC 28013]